MNAIIKSTAFRTLRLVSGVAILVASPLLVATMPAAASGTVALFVDASVGLATPNAIAFDSSDNLYVVVTVFVDASVGLANPNAIAFDSSDNLYVLNAVYGFVSKFDPAGALLSLQLATVPPTPQGIVVDRVSGDLFVSNWNGEVYRVNSNTGEASLYAITNAASNGGLAQDSAGNLYLSAGWSNRVLRIDATDQSVSVCLEGVNNPRGLAFDSAGRLYVAVFGAEQVIRVNGCGTGELVASGFSGPFGLAFDSAGNLYVANENGNHVSRVTPDGGVSTFASGFVGASGLALNSAGILYVSDDTQRVFQVAPAHQFKCYKAKSASGTAKFQQRTVTLSDEFESKNTRVLKPVSICNPVSTNGERILDPTAHLECYKISAVRGQPRFTRHNVSIEDQFGAETLTATKAATLCVPSEIDGQPSVLNLDHFKCYTAKTARGTAKFQQRTVSLEDDFETKNTTVVKPVSICNPVDADGAGINDPRPHLECYQIKDVSGQVPFFAKNVAVQNEFDSETLTAQKADTLCVVASE